MQKIEKKKENNHYLKAGIIFALVVIAAFSPIVFLDQTYYRNTPIPPELLDVENKTTVFGVTADYSDIGVWPNVKLSKDLILKGIAPLWNPHTGLGAPLGAESTYHIFSPYNLGFFLPSSLWDIPILIGVWLAGFFTFLFLRSLNLKFIPAITGGIFFMLSGGITWYLTNPNFLVVMITPLILYSIEKIFQSKNPKFIILLSISFLLTILAGHLETIVLQFLFVGIYFFYRIIIKGEHKRRIDKQKLIIILFCVIGFIGGLGLSAFYIFPVYELIDNNVLEHEVGTGLSHYPTINVITSFVPYALGQIHAYWIASASGLIGFWGYVGIFALFFSIVGVCLSLKNREDVIHRYTPLFFMCVSIFFIMKTIGVPVINWIGFIPIFDILLFTNYSGLIMSFSFAVSAAFGINLLTKIKVDKKILIFIFAFTIILLLILLIPLYSYLSPDVDFPEYVSPDDAKNYVGFQILQAVLFAASALIISIGIMKNKSAIFVIVPLVLLELSLYIPLGLHPIFLAYKFIIIFLGIITLTVLVLKPNKLTWNVNNNTIKLPVLFGILIIIFFGVVLISELSSFGMMKKTDSFDDNPVSDFVKTNIGNHRMFSFGYSMQPDYPSAYGINSIGTLSPFTIASFTNFTHNFLDKDEENGRLGFPPWTYSYGPMESIKKFYENKKYFDFLGVKYIITEGYNFDSISVGTPGNTREITKIQDTEASVSQSFVSPVNTINAIGVSISAFQLEENDTIILSLDSIPYDERYHRESTVKNITNQKYNQFNFDTPLENILNKKLIFSLEYPQLNNDKFAVVHTIAKDQTGFDYAKNELQGTFYENNSSVDTKQMVFTILPDLGEQNRAFQFKDIYIKENYDVFPRAFLVNNFTVVEKDTAQEYLLKNPDFNLRQNVILEEKLSNELINQLKVNKYDKSNNVNIISYDANNILIKTGNNDASILVLTDIYYPGWRAFVDETETKIYRADGLVRAIFIPEGQHTIEFVYQPESYYNGIIISLVSAIILISTLLFYKINQTRKVTLK